MDIGRYNLGSVWLCDGNQVIVKANRWPNAGSSNADYKNTPIGAPKPVFSAILSIVLGLMLICGTHSQINLPGMSRSSEFTIRK